MNHSFRVFSSLFVLILLMTGCSKNDSVEENLPPGQLTLFEFSSTQNKIPSSSTTISGNEITVHFDGFPDVTSLVASYTGIFKKVMVNGVEQSSGTYPHDFTNPVQYDVVGQDGVTVSYTVKITCFNNLPVVYVNTVNSQDITSKDTYLYGTMKMINTSGFTSGNFEDDSIQIKGRGNATFYSYPKKAYKVKLSSKASLLDMPKDKEWVLLPNYCDKSLLRLSVAFKLSEMLNMPWTPKSEFVDLYLNGDYHGTYLLCEHVKKSKDRVNIDDDGYFFENDNYYKEEPVYMTSSRGYHYTFKYPDPDEITAEQIQYLQNYINKFEEVLKSYYYADENVGYRKYIDVDCFAKWFLINEVLDNIDCNYYYFFKSRSDTKMYMSPVWDFEWSLGYGFSWDANAPAEPISNIYHKNSYYFDRLFQDPYFVSVVKKHWQTVKDDIPKLVNYINSEAEHISLSQKMNFKRWNILGKKVAVETVWFGTWDEEVYYLKSYLQKRAAWFDTAISTW